MPKLFGIPIRLDPSWFVIAFLLAWSLAQTYFPSSVPGLSRPAAWGIGAVASVLLFSCVLLHELGHALAARAFGIPVARVTLFIFGGVAEIGHDPKRPWIELVIALAGPLVSAMIALGCFLTVDAMAAAKPAHLMLLALVRYLMAVNLALIAFNLLPGFPLDGGRVMRALLWQWGGSLRTATRRAGLIGVLLGVGLMAVGGWECLQGEWVGGVWYVLLGLFLRKAALTYYRAAHR